ncbi:MAG: HAMP domain-containing protein, partial [Anaerolineales bacterium]|nr:HAMP domain-containing protein [Anaerolineales bacterium]
MFASLRSRFLLSFALISGATLLVFGLVLLPLSLIPTRIALEANAARLIRANRASVRLLVSSGSLADLPALRDSLGEVATAYDVRLLVLAPDVPPNGRVTVRYDSENSWQGNPITPNALPTRQLALLPPDLPPQVTIERFRAPDGTSWLMLTQPLPTRRNASAIAFAVPEVSQLEAFRRFFLQPVLWAVLVTAVLALFLALALSRWITRPLQNLLTATDALAAGEYSYRLEEGHGPTEVKRVAHNFNLMAGQVEQSQQAQRDFVANVSHDLKTPLTSIQGWSQALLDGAASTPEQQQKAAGVIHTETERMTRLVNQLLDLARLESGQVPLRQERVDLTAVVEATLRSLRWQATEKNIALTTENIP